MLFLSTSPMSEMYCQVCCKTAGADATAAHQIRRPTPITSGQQFLVCSAIRTCDVHAAATDGAHDMTL